MQRSSFSLVLLAAAVVLTSAAWLRSAEYDEQYTLFITAGVARPVWPMSAFTAGEVRALQDGRAGLVSIAQDLRRTDVHPPLYFWAVATWRSLFGGGLFVARLASVACGVAALAAVGAIAWRTGVPVALAMLLTLGCYGFVYTGAIARGFALAQVLTLSGVAVLLWAGQRGRFALIAGLLLGAATFANYLAVFVATAALLWLVLCQRRGELPQTWLPACIGFALWLPADLWFFLPQHHSRPGQFPPFELLPALALHLRYSAANVFGGLPLYVGDAAGVVLTVFLAGLLTTLAALIGWRWRGIATRSSRLLFVMAAVAPSIGLLVLGVAFDNTPVELRYLAFGTPFVALLLAGAFATLKRSWRHMASGVVLTLQAASVFGLLTRPETMQPARATATAAATLVRDGVVLVPFGNDGVGIVGAFADEAPAALRLLVVGRHEAAVAIRARVAGFSRVVVALLGQDSDSRATLPAMRAAFAEPCWRAASAALNVLAFERVCADAPIAPDCPPVPSPQRDPPMSTCPPNCPSRSQRSCAGSGA